jgi:RNA polymerase-binding transcription factor DksA
MKNQIKATAIYPKKVLEPIKDFLEEREKKLDKQKQELSKEDPFANTDRLADNAAVDAGAWRKFGHASLEAVGSELEKGLINVRKALTLIKLGKYGMCQSCGQMIDTDRLAIDPTVTKCVKCAKKKTV